MAENTGNIGFEETLWKAADKLRGSMDASEYKHVVLGLIFLKYISDKFETKFNALVEEGAGFEEDRDEYEAENIFWVPKEARWSFIKDNAKDSKIGQYIDDAMILIEKENPSLKGVLDKRYARPEIDKRRLGELIDLISTIKLHQNGEKDLLGRVYEYFLGQFASVEGKGGGEFYTPTSVVKTLVDMIEPYQGRVYDPCCGSGGMFVQSEKFVEDHQGKIENLSIYGQEMNSTTWKLCKMNLAIRGLDANLGPHHDDTFHHDLHKTLKADFILANPPFNISDWGGNQLTDDVRWKFGIPPAGNANYAWLQGEFYTPTSVVKTLVDMIEPYQGRVYDPCCGSGGMFVQSEKFVEDHQGKIENLSIYGQEMNSTTWKLCKMNLAIRGLDANLGPHHDDTFHHDLHKTLKADYILANPPFNISDWGGNQLTDDVRWKFGIPPVGNANYAWLQHMVYHLAPNGSAGIVLANGSLSSNTSNEGEIRKNLLEGDMVDAIVALPDKLFYSTGIPVSLWILNRNKKNNPKFRSREHEVLFIDARQMGEMIDRRHRELTEEDVSKISETYHEWRNIDGEYEDIKGFCKSAKIEEIREHEYVLTPGRYVGIEDVEDDGIPFDEKIENMTAELAELFAKSRHLEDEIRKNLGGIGYEF